MPCSGIRFLPLAVEIQGIPHLQSCRWSLSQPLCITGNFGSPREGNLAARSPPWPSHKLPGSKLQAQKYTRTVGRGWFSTQYSRKKQALTICNPLGVSPSSKTLPEHEFPSTCSSQPSPPGCFRGWEQSTATAAALYFLPYSETHLRMGQGEVEREMEHSNIFKSFSFLREFWMDTICFSMLFWFSAKILFTSLPQQGNPLSRIVIFS